MFKPGDKKPEKSGRKRGTLNKNRQILIEKANELGVDPFEILLRFASGDWKGLGYDEEKYVHSANENGTFYKYTIEPATRAKCASEACQYLHPKRKAVELTGEDGGAIVIAEPVSPEEELKYLKAARGIK